MIYSAAIIFLIIILLFAPWCGSDLLFRTPFTLPILLGTFSGALIFTAILPLVESLQGRELRRAWRIRLEAHKVLPRPPGWRDLIHGAAQTLNDKLDWLFKAGWAETTLRWWRDSGAGTSPLSLLAALLAVIASGVLLSQYFLETSLLKIFFQLLLLIGLASLIYSRARMRRRLFHDQFPAVLERLSDSLEAGFSLTQAIEFVVPNLSQPSSNEMALIVHHIRLGFTVDQALMELYQRRPIEDVRIFVEGLTLQRLVGGDISAMMRDLAQLVRSRVELENETKTLTAQGRLSAVVIALLVPISLGTLSLFPGYTDVLYKSTIGNLVLVAAGVLELLGTVLVARVIRIEI